MHLNSSFHQNEAVMIVKTMTLGTKQVCLIFDVLTFSRLKKHFQGYPVLAGFNLMVQK